MNPFEFDMALLRPVHSIMERGIRIDSARRDEFKHDYHTRWTGAQEKLRKVCGFDLNVNSPKQVGEFLYDSLRLPERRFGGSRTTREEALRSLMAFCDDKRSKEQSEEKLMRWLRGYMAVLFVLKIRGIRKRLNSYIDIAIDTDERMRTTLSVGGTEEARFSSSKTLWNTGCNLQTIPKELRPMFIADEGKEFCEFDLGRGESWVYSHLASDPEMMDIHTSGGDFHAETASTISYAFAMEPLTADEINAKISEGDKAADRLRFLGKKINHAAAYRMGPITAADEVNKEADDTGITITSAQAKVALRLWRERYFCMPMWWDAIVKQLGIDRTLVTPYGRKRTFFERWGDGLFKEATAYVPASTSADYTNHGLLRVYNELQLKGAYDLEILLQVHDSILTQYDPRHREEVIGEVTKRIQSRIVVNEHEIMIPVEAAYGPSWGELKEWEE